MRRALVSVIAAITLAAAASRVRAQDAAAHTRRSGRVLLEVGAGNASSHLPCGYRSEGDSRYGVEGDQLALHAGVGFAPSARVSLLHEADAGQRVSFDRRSPAHQYHTLMAELAPRRCRWVALRVGAGGGWGDDLEAASYGSGAVVRVGLALRTSPARRGMLVVAADGFQGVSGRFPGRSPELARRFGPRTLQLAATLRLQLGAL
jgi:hypothetical protein